MLVGVRCDSRKGCPFDPCDSASIGHFNDRVFAVQYVAIVLLACVKLRVLL